MSGTKLQPSVRCSVPTEPAGHAGHPGREAAPHRPQGGEPWSRDVALIRPQHIEAGLRIEGWVKSNHQGDLATPDGRRNAGFRLDHFPHARVWCEKRAHLPNTWVTAPIPLWRVHVHPRDLPVITESVDAQARLRNSRVRLIRAYGMVAEGFADQ